MKIEFKQKGYEIKYSVGQTIGVQEEVGSSKHLAQITRIDIGSHGALYRLSGFPTNLCFCEQQMCSPEEIGTFESGIYTPPGC